MNLIKTYIDRSPIHGIGLFAEENIKEGTVIWELGGLDIVMTDKNFKSKIFTPNQLKYMKNYIYFKDGYWIWCSDDARFTNHSTDPNTSITLREQVAIKDIKKGEEITCNYYELDNSFTEEEFNDN